MSRISETVYIQDAFQYLVASGTCVAYWIKDYSYTSEDGGHWEVHINGRRFIEDTFDCEYEYHFTCKTESGTVKVSFPLKKS